MPNSYRIRTQPGVDKSIRVQIDQEFEYLEILSLKILQSQVYTRQCSDYGVIVGRISVNNGLGIPNAKVSVFIPLTVEDEQNPVISELYPYKTLSDRNEDNYRYNLLSYVESYNGHVPTGTFPQKLDVLTNPNLIEVYDKYYKYTTVTNDSGDYMIFGVPVGNQTIFVDIDLSDIGEFSLSPQDLIRMGIATENMVDNGKFKASENLDSLPQIISFNRDIEVEPLWGEPDICNLGITRTDFDVTREANIDINPQSIFIGSIFSDIDDYAQKSSCKPNKKTGSLCNLTTAPGKILAIRHTLNLDTKGRPALELFTFENGGQVIDENGTWYINLPMNLDYVTTNEFGERILSNDTKIGVPTKGRYRFKVKWNQSPSLSLKIRRANYLIPNIKEHGWDDNGDLVSQAAVDMSYSFSVNWDDYGDDTTTLGQQMILDGIYCEDRFYEFNYNKVYTVSNLITQYKKGGNKRKYISIKNILDETCESENVKFPTNDVQYNFDFVFLLFLIMMNIFNLLAIPFITILHVVKVLICTLIIIVGILSLIVCGLKAGICALSNLSILGVSPFGFLSGLCDTLTDGCEKLTNTLNFLVDKCANGLLKLGSLTYPDCEQCNCSADEQQTTSDVGSVLGQSTTNSLTPTNSSSPIGGFLTQSNYTCGDSNQVYQSLLFTGKYTTQTPTLSDRTTGVFNYNTNPYEFFFTSNLPISERFNLFNTKGKYFDTLPGGGVNQIRTTFGSNMNDSGTTYHYDNILMLIVPSSLVNQFTTGKIVTFTNPTASTDPNVDGATTTNSYGNNSITGSTIGTQIGTTNISQSTITVDYANPNGSGNLTSPPYIITGLTDDYLYHKFPIDVEYFQVIESITVNDYLNECNTNPATKVPDSLTDRFINFSVRNTNIVFDSTPPISTANCVLSNDLLYSSCYNNYSGQTILFLTRGVDPYSTRTQCTFDLSRLYNFNSWGNKVVTGNFKLNIPIQGSYKCVKHDNITNNNSQDSTYSGEKLFYDSYHYKPGSEFITFDSNTISYYSRIDSNTSSPSATIVNPMTGLLIDSINEYTKEWNNQILLPSCTIYSATNNTPNTGQNRGYFPNESVEGGSYMYLSETLNLGPSTVHPSSNSLYRAEKYPSTVSVHFETSTLGVNGNQIVMRSDRLPTSTTTNDVLSNSFPLFTNSNFSIYTLDDNGFNIPTQYTPPSSNISSGDFNDFSEDYPDNPLISTFTCDGLIPLSCYYTENGVVKFHEKPHPCYTTLVGNDEIIEKGCYVLGHVPFISLPGDINRYFEWSSRYIATYAACRNVFGHVFTNNWINGTLYMFPFQNDTFFDELNQPQAKYCSDTLYFNNSNNNFYYRCSRYSNSGKFIGKKSPSFKEGIGSSEKADGNIRNLMYPTTILDMGPKSKFTQELTLSNEYSGYIMDKFKATTFNDVSDLLNFFIISRFTSSYFFNNLAVNFSGVKIFFNKRENSFMDGDYPQMVSINSEFGVSPFDNLNYSTSELFNGNALNDSIIGVFFKSNLQDRDYITPKRDILFGQGNVGTSNCAFETIPVKTQTVPFYQWILGDPKYPNTIENPYIFGSEKDDWYTNHIKDNVGQDIGFFSYKYQNLDRILQTSRYFRTTNQSQTDYFKGYIYAVDGSGNLTPDLNYSQPNPIIGNAITVGAPFHFYFGLKQGRTAFDRFAIDYIDFENIVE